eukprot:CAMPEP_0206144974 /NCGR_PEP_ID=MMETSP1473-20131121/25992_1 /ASSEMBLY_ACC=CAM_ASM_001109 /TAXON_ID=1461547 /ORGANISM="Stichococcus sp, Strain RCC1054" /LENGTH=419 /DNA_ID=CAMNT_0053541011 /DNA_START=141 /DNA_END=1400 /DNA_ORIENTATION=-
MSKLQRRQQRRCTLLIILAAALVTILAYERDEVARDTEALFHHNLSTPKALSVPVSAGSVRATRDPTIFVSAIAYREPECHLTLKDMFEKAALPGRVYAGVCQQNFLPAGSPEDCAVERLPPTLQGNVRVFAMNSTDAKGIPLARARASQQYDGQDYWLQIDAHSRFDPGWDQRLIDMYEQLKECSPKPVISTYPPAITEMDGTPKQKASNPFTRICNGTFSGGPHKTMFRLTSHRFRSHGFAVRTPFAAGGFMFGAGKILREVPHDANMPFLFDGDEILFSVRLFTSGWDVFVPSEQVVYHRYVSYGERKVNVYTGRQNAEWVPHRENSTARVMYVLGMTDELPPEEARVGMESHGLGVVRDMEAWRKWSGVDFRDMTHVGAGDKFCKEVQDLPMSRSRVCPISAAARNTFAKAQKAG